jgi:hypothetical protein
MGKIEKSKQPGESTQDFAGYLVAELNSPCMIRDAISNTWKQAQDANGNPMTKEQAIVQNLINKAMSGDIPSIQYIQSLKALARKDLTKKK